VTRAASSTSDGPGPAGPPRRSSHSGWCSNTALGHDAERGGQRPAGRRPDRSSQRSDAAGTARSSQPVADGALVAVVELHDVDRDLLAARREGFQIAKQILFPDPVEEVVPAAPAGLEGTPGARSRCGAELARKILEKPVRVLAQSHPDPLHRTKVPSGDRDLEADLHLEAHPLPVGLQVDGSGPDAAFQHAGQTRSGGGGATDHRDQVRLVPSGAIGGRRADAVVDAAQPGTGGKGGLPRGVQGPRAGEGPGLPAVAQEAQGARLDLRPAEPQHHRLQVERALAPVANQDVIAGDVSGRVERHRQLEGTQALDARHERSLDEADGFDHPLVATLREGGPGVAHSQANHFHASSALPTCDRGAARHGSGV
jgi:hypothetical protein